MKRLITKVMVEIEIAKTILALFTLMICDTFSDWYNYKISLSRAVKTNKILYKNIFEITLMDKSGGVTEKDKRIWIERRFRQKEDYLKQMGER